MGAASSSWSRLGNSGEPTETIETHKQRRERAGRRRVPRLQRAFCSLTSLQGTYVPDRTVMFYKSTIKKVKAQGSSQDTLRILDAATAALQPGCNSRAFLLLSDRRIDGFHWGGQRFEDHIQLSRIEWWIDDVDTSTEENWLAFHHSNLLLLMDLLRK